MKKYPLFSSLVLIVLFGCILFYFQNSLLSGMNFRWIFHFNPIPISIFCQYIFLNFCLAILITIAFTFPCYLWNEISLKKLLSWSLSLSFFMITAILSISISAYFENTLDFKLEDLIYIPLPTVIYLTLFPLGIYLISKSFLNVSIKLFFLILIFLPLTVLASKINFFSKFLLIDVRHDFDTFYSLIMILNLISNIYFKNSHVKFSKKHFNNILDYPV